MAIEMSPKNLGRKALDDLDRDLAAIEAGEEDKKQVEPDGKPEQIGLNEKLDAGDEEDARDIGGSLRKEVPDGHNGGGSVDAELNEKEAYGMAEDKDGRKSKEQMEKKGPEELKKEMEDSFQKLAHLQERFMEAKRGRLKMKKLKELLGFKQNWEESWRNSQAAKDLETIKAKLEESRGEFRGKFGAYGQHFVDQKLVELKRTGQNAEEIKNEILSFMYTEKVIDSGEMGKNGEKITRTISEEYNKRLFDLDKLKAEKLPSKTKKIFAQLWNGYRNLPKSAKLALSAALAVGIGVATGAIGGIGAAAFFGGKRVAKGYFGMALGGAVGGLAGSSYNIIQAKQNTKKGKTSQGFRERAENELMGKIGEVLEPEGGTGMVVEKGMLEGLERRKQVLDEMIEHQRKQLRNRMIAAGLAGVIAGGGVSMLAGGLFDVDSASNSNLKTGLDHNEGIKLSEIDSKEPILRKIPGAEQNDILPERQRSIDHGRSGVALAGEKSPEAIDVKPLRLEKGDSVWKVLKNEGMSDREIMKKVNAFSKDVGEKLMGEPHNMTKEQALAYINGRFSHMDIGEQFRIDESGNLKIDSFLNDQKLGHFQHGLWDHGAAPNNSGTVEVKSVLSSTGGGKLFEGLKEVSSGIDQTYEKVGKLSPKQVFDFVSSKDSGVSIEGKEFLYQMFATNVAPKPGETFKDFTERYFDFKATVLTEKQFKALANIYEKIPTK